MKNRPAQDERPRTVLVVYDTDEGAQGEQEEELKCRNPGNGATGVIFQRSNLVVLLEATHT